MWTSSSGDSSCGQAPRYSFCGVSVTGELKTGKRATVEISELDSSRLCRFFKNDRLNAAFCVACVCYAHGPTFFRSPKIKTACAALASSIDVLGCEKVYVLASSSNGDQAIECKCLSIDRHRVKSESHRCSMTRSRVLASAATRPSITAREPMMQKKMCVCVLMLYLR